MSLSHKAFALDGHAFEVQLAPTLRQALLQGDTSALQAFIDTHWESLKDPYEGEPLSPDWRSQLEAGDVQELADFALTRYYDPKADFGIGEEWGGRDPDLPGVQRQALLGAALEEGGQAFDPGRMGSYFQDPGCAALSLQVLGQVDDGGAMGAFKRGLQQAVRAGCGAYITF